MVISSIVALLASTLFTGAAIYISLVEHPARLLLDDGPLLAQWQPSYDRALPIQSGLAIVGGVAGLIACYLSANWIWAAGSLILLANWPFTLLVIFPVNKRLHAITPSAANAESRQLLLKWGRLHHVRSVLGATAAIVFAWGVAAAAG
ncbi:DUF1772 domain-containing protein [Sphingomonas montanisoli]|uniref:DUF1772 domain-containing protein n=1 Tax=Sphingomonas montanisoli TaxID=2606412 RepID=A0A5D9C0J7_9SPHN|nr:DUF1772 domain-containing protein [Sphingomonas montanisoli]TZG24953.1 DUF1772 domain-containing protein [Sphingomonas montanisoli]